MKKFLVFALALCLIPGLAKAQSPQNGSGQLTSGNTSTGATSTNTGSGVSQSGSGNIVNQGGAGAAGQAVEGGAGGAGGAGGTGGNSKSSAVALGGESKSNSNSESKSSSNNNGGNVAISTPRQTATAYAPTMLPTASCFKPVGFGAQMPVAGISFGGGKIDQNCASLEVARSFAQVQDYVAYCKVMLTNKFVKQAGISMEDCMNQYIPPVAVLAPVEAPQAPVITVNVPAIPVNIELPAPVATPTQVCPAPPVHRKKHQPVKPCVN